MDNQQSKQDRSRTKWTEALDKVFVDLALEQVIEGNWAESAFNKTGWKNIREEFLLQTGLDFDRKQLKKHLDVLRNRYLNMKKHLEQKSVGREESARYVMNGEEYMSLYLQVDPAGETSRSKDVPIYDQLCKIFAQPMTLGKYAQSSHYIGVDQQSLASERPNPTNVPLVYSPSRSGMDASIDSQKKRKYVMPPSASPQQKNHKLFDGLVADALLEMATASKQRAEVMVQCIDKFSITNCMQLLDDLPALEDSFYFAALKLFENPNLREIFVSLKKERRSIWLQGKCASASVP